MSYSQQKEDLPRTVSEAVTGLIVNAPFFAFLLYEKMHIYVQEGYGTAGTDGKRITIDPKFFESITIKERVFVVCHEICHAMYMHFPRAKRYFVEGFEGEKFSPEAWNIATDLIINDLLIESGIGYCDKSKWLWSPKYKHDMLAEDVYKAILEKNPQLMEGNSPPCEGGAGGEAPSQGGEGKSNEFADDSEDYTEWGKRFDKHEKPQPNAPAEATQERDWKQAVAGASQAAKMAGDLPGALARFVEDLVEPKVDWREQLRHAVTKKTGMDATDYSRPNRRRLAFQPMVYMPRRSSYGCKLVVLAGDTSGSIGQPELTAFLSETAGIFTEVHPERVFFLWIDAKIHDIIEIDNPTDIELLQKPLGGGGTNFNPVFEWIEKEGLEPDVCVYFTDLYGPYPRTEPDYPVIWCCTSDKEADWGETIKIEL